MEPSSLKGHSRIMRVSRAVKQVDVVISAMSSSDISTMATQLQLKIVIAIKDARNVKMHSKSGTRVLYQDIDNLEPVAPHLLVAALKEDERVVSDPKLNYNISS
ncbi:hypothetical protein Syun_031300 [Stephania yunnanensis]|uniref:Uncharacterized protein n=1 Tax=Stephania yunnanensis TaxID=152371 RepID=A0AAP0E037_9MAGN